MYTDIELLNKPHYSDLTLELLDGPIKVHSIYLRKLKFFDNFLNINKFPNKKIFNFNFYKKPMFYILKILYSNKIQTFIQDDDMLLFKHEKQPNETLFQQEEEHFKINQYRKIRIYDFFEINEIMQMYEIAEYINFDVLINRILDNLFIDTINNVLVCLKYTQYSNIKNIVNDYFLMQPIKIEEIKKILLIQANFSKRKKFNKCTLIVKDEPIETLEEIFTSILNIFDKIDIFYVNTNVTRLLSKINMFYRKKNFITNYDQLIKIILNICIENSLIDEHIFEEFDDKGFTEKIKIMFEIKKLKTKYLIFRKQIDNEKFLSDEFEMFRIHGFWFYDIINKENNLSVHEEHHIKMIFEKINEVDKVIYFETDVDIKFNKENMLKIFKYIQSLCWNHTLNQNLIKLNKLVRHELCENNILFIKNNLDIFNEKQYTNIKIEIINKIKYGNTVIKYIKAHKEILIKLEYFNNLFKYTDKVYFDNYDYFTVYKVIECVYSQDFQKIFDNIKTFELLKIYNFANFVCYNEICDYISKIIMISDAKQLELVVEYNDIYENFLIQINKYVTENGFSNLNLLIKYFLNDTYYKKIINKYKCNIVKWIINSQEKEINLKYMINISNMIFGYDEKIFYNCINYFKKEKNIYKNLKYDNTIIQEKICQRSIIVFDDVLSKISHIDFQIEYSSDFYYYYYKRHFGFYEYLVLPLYDSNKENSSDDTI